MSELSTNLNNLGTIANIAHQIPIDPTQLEIRAVREEEIHCVADIITCSFHFDKGWMAWFTPLFKLGIAEDLRNRIRPRGTISSYQKPQQQICSVAVVGVDKASPLENCEQVVGTVEVGVRTADRHRPSNYRYVYLSNLAVSRDFRRRGVAQELIKRCELLTIEWGYTEIHLHVMGDNDRGQNLYRKLGYEVISSEFVWSIIPWHREERFFLRKQLV